MGYMLRRFLPLLLTLAAALPAGAQIIRLTHYQAPSALYADMGQLFNYNLYEHARFEAGLTWVQPNISFSGTSVRGFLGQWTLSAYGAYGVQDRAFKYGASVQLRPGNYLHPGKKDLRLRLAFKDDLERAASRRLEDYRMTATSLNSGYLASRFSRVQALEGKVIWKPATHWETSVGLRYSREQERFDSTGMIYNSLQPWVNYTEAALRVDYTDRDYHPTHRLTLLLQPGVAYPSQPQPYLRLIAQYAYGEVDEFGADVGLHLWAQAGYATGKAPTTRRFDVSGTGGTPYYFEHTFLTVPPDRFLSDLFAHLCVKYIAPEPLWKSLYSNPRPFLQANAAIADLGVHGGWLHKVADRSSPLLEPATGFDGILRWGILDMGIAVAYRIIPFDTINPTDNIAFAIVARLIV